MKVSILSLLPDSYSVRRLTEEGQKRGHEVSTLDYLRCSIILGEESSSLSYEGEKIKNVGAVIPRIASGFTFFGCSVIRQFEMLGVYCLNGSLGVSRAKDKLRSLQILERKGIPFPLSAFSHATSDVEGMIKAVGGAPLIIKLLEGTQGIGVIKADNKTAAQSVLEAFSGLKSNMIVQEYIEEAAGEDIRVFVIGDKVVASMKRKAPEGEFRSNIHRGGKGEKVKITPEERKMAVKATKEMKLNVAGVDLIRSKNGPLVLEVNSSPGLEGIETVSEKNIAGLIMDFIEKQYEQNKSRVTI